MTAKELEYHIILVDKAAAGMRGLESSFERSPAVGKMSSNSITCYREMVPEKVNPFSKRCVLCFF